MASDKPKWAQRMYDERIARGWIHPVQAVRAMIAHADRQLLDEEALTRMWRRWERGEVFPRDYADLIAKTFGTVPDAFFPHGRRDGQAEILDVSGMDTVDIVARLRASDVDQATLDAVGITVDRLCSEYPYMASEQLALEGRSWLQRVTAMQHQRLSLPQHREALVQAGMLALLVGCVEYDSGNSRAAEATRRAALTIGEEAGHPRIVGWAHEMRAWFSLTNNNLHGVIAASEAGIEAAPTDSVAVQLWAQKAKAWARVGDRRQVEVALDAGRSLLETMPYPDNPENHFTVDPAKWDFYAMDCYRRLGEDQLAENLARQVLSEGIELGGRERSPMRTAEARITLGVAAARAGDLDAALDYGEHALAGDRRSIPSLSMVSEELGSVLNQRFQDAPAAREFTHHLADLRKV